MLARLAAVSLAAQTADSLALLRTARRAQDHFERYRVDHVPRSFDGAGGRCDEIVGRFCFWHDDDEDESWRPPPEPPDIAVARGRLIATLDSVARLLPGDGWVAGQRVRYLVEAGDSAGAVAAASACGAERWWCLALAGYALHAIQAFAAADSAFHAALSQMPAEERCRWTDLSLVAERLPGSYAQASCAARAETERAVWWLADPLYVIPGNERRTEHFARHVMNRMQAGARSGYGLRWGDDLRELLLRYGWPIAFTRNDTRRSFDATGTSITAHHHPAGRRFLPDRELVLGGLDPDRPRSNYAPPYAASVEEMETQVAVFRRGDSTVIVAGYDLRGARRFPPGEVRVEGALAVTPDPDASPIVVRADGTGPQGVLALIAPGPPGLVSVEAVVRGDTVRAYRARQVLPVPPATPLAVSDPLLLRVSDEDSLPGSLEDAFSASRGTTRLSSGERVGLFWEMYGLDAQPAGATVSLTVTRSGAGLLRRAAEWAGLAGRYRPSVSLTWVEPPATRRVHPRSLVITLPETGPGTYVLEIAALLEDGSTATTRRELSIEK